LESSAKNGIHRKGNASPQGQGKKRQIFINGGGVELRIRKIRGDPTASNWPRGDQRVGFWSLVNQGQSQKGFSSERSRNGEGPPGTNLRQPIVGEGLGWGKTQPGGKPGPGTSIGGGKAACGTGLPGEKKSRRGERASLPSPWKGIGIVTSELPTGDRNQFQGVCMDWAAGTGRGEGKRRGGRLREKCNRRKSQAEVQEQDTSMMGAVKALEKKGGGGHRPGEQREDQKKNQT